ncbi:MAG TPA: nuclear transport factor 2 family protein [Burkholderiaceae bacterium]|nr:nuclear transport factor 2 family protein [Burkholderiaceae bacterium]
MSNVAGDFDPIAIVVDWIDACRMRNLDALLDLYADDAKLECACEGSKHEGRVALASYWRPRLEQVAPTAFGLEQVTPAADGVVLDYISFEGKHVRAFFAFDAAGRIQQTRCGPGPALQT